MSQTSIEEMQAEVESSMEIITQAVDESQLKALFSKAGVGAEQLAGNGFTYRHDWGNFSGKRILNLTWPGVIDCNSRVWVSATEFGGGAQCGFVGNAPYTIQNVATNGGLISVRVNVEWDRPIRVRLDYLIVNP